MFAHYLIIQYSKWFLDEEELLLGVAAASIS
jgi:hypothetical protein